jgi:hypothetical protein
MWLATHGGVHVVSYTQRGTCGQLHVACVHTAASMWSATQAGRMWSAKDSGAACGYVHTSGCMPISDTYILGHDCNMTILP